MEKNSSFENSRVSRYQPGELRPFRVKIVIGFFCLSFLFLVFRAVVIHLFPPSKDSLQDIAEKQYLEQIQLAPYRGTIFDRRGEPLAISVKTPSLHVNPRVFRPTQEEKEKLSNLLGLSIKQIDEIAKKRNYFVWLKRKVSHAVAAKVMDLKIDGLFELSEPARYYPAGKAAAHLLGYVGTDNYGLLGIERLYEKDLRGQSVRVSQSKDARGQILFLSSSNVAPEKTGNNIYLSIDRAIQEIAEDELEKGVREAKADSGFAIVSDPHTGRFLALASFPTFDPNNPKDLDIKDTRNKAIMDAFEPGSILKPFVIMKALENKKVSLLQKHDCENGTIQIGKHKIRDTHQSKELTTEDVLVYSSNIGTYKVAQKLGMEGLYRGLLDFGLGSGDFVVGFSGEAVGRLSPWTTWQEVKFANIAFGQGIMTTGPEIVRAFGTIANGGNLMKPIVLDRVESSDGMIIAISSSQIERRVMNPNTAKVMRSLLERVVVKGTGSNALTKDYTTGGKTGTAQKVEPGKKAYSLDKRLASFAGFAPVGDPHIVVFVAIDEPGEKPYFGNTWASPVFKGIVERTLRYLNVAPDKEEASIAREMSETTDENFEKKADEVVKHTSNDKQQEEMGKEPTKKL